MASEEKADIPSAPVGELDLRQEVDEAEWDRRVMKLAAERIRAARARLQRLGIVDSGGELISAELPPDMDPASESTLETG